MKRVKKALNDLKVILLGDRMLTILASATGGSLLTLHNENLGGVILLVTAGILICRLVTFLNR